MSMRYQSFITNLYALSGSITISAIPKGLTSMKHYGIPRVMVLLITGNGRIYDG
jgi:hypothetical protein